MLKAARPVILTAFCSCVAVTLLIISPGSIYGQSSDSVFMKAGTGGASKKTGKITETSKNGVTLQGRNGADEIPVQNIRKITFAGEPTSLERAKSRLESGRYDDCLAELAKIDDPPTELIKSEIAFMKAYSQAQKSLKGGDVTAQQAGSAIRTFVQNNPDSHHFYPSTDILGQLLVGIGKPDLAEKEFAKLAQSEWPSMKIKGLFQQGNALILTGDLENAKKAFSQIVNMDANDDESQQFKLVAQCQIAKIMALQGDSDGGRAIVEKIIKEENPDNSLVFAYAYNSLGTCHLQSQQPKPAAIAFLHTELLYGTESAPHAEALYNLCKLWPQLEETDRANRARQALKSRYRNTYWALQL